MCYSYVVVGPRFEPIVVLQLKLLHWLRMLGQDSVVVVIGREKYCVEGKKGTSQYLVNYTINSHYSDELPKKEQD